MRYITLQNKCVLQTLKETGIYRIDPSLQTSFELAYKKMMKFYGWKSGPIFLVPVGSCGEMNGATVDENTVVLEFEIPDEFCKFQEFYSWTDYIFSLESPTESERTYNEKELKNILCMTVEEMLWSNNPIQTTVECLKKEWLIRSSTEIKLYIDRYINIGGVYIMQGIDQLCHNVTNYKEGKYELYK